MRVTLALAAVVVLFASGCAARRVAVPPPNDAVLRNGARAEHDGLRVRASHDGRWIVADQDGRSAKTQQLVVATEDDRIALVGRDKTQRFDGLRPPFTTGVARVFGRPSCEATNGGFVAATAVATTARWYPGWILDVGRGRVVDAGTANLLFSHEGRGLFEDEFRTLFVLDAGDGSRTSLERLHHETSRAVAGALYVHDGTVIDLSKRAVIGSCGGRWFALDTNARCLTYEPELGKPFDPDRHLVWRPVQPAQAH